MLKKTIFLTVTISFFNLLAQLQPLDASFAVPKSFASVMNNTWKMPARSLRSAPMTLGVNDTIVYTLVRERQRNVSFSIDGSKTQIVDAVVKGNMLTGTQVVQEAGTYLFKIRNRSFLSNTIFFEVKKNVPKPEAPPNTGTQDPKKDSAHTSTKPKFVLKDTLLVAYDSVHYVACSLNLKQSSVFALPIDSVGIYNYFVTKSSNINLLGPNRRAIALQACEDVQRPSELIKDRAELVIYACAKQLPTKVLGKHNCMLLLPMGAMAQNEDKVVGKSLHVQIIKLKSVLKSNTP